MEITREENAKKKKKVLFTLYLNRYDRDHQKCSTHKKIEARHLYVYVMYTVRWKLFK